MEDFAVRDTNWMALILMQKMRKLVRFEWESFVMKLWKNSLETPPEPMTTLDFLEEILKNS